MVATSERHTSFAGPYDTFTAPITGSVSVSDSFDPRPRYEWNLQNDMYIHIDTAYTPTTNGYSNNYYGIPFESIGPIMQRKKIMATIDELSNFPQKVELSKNQIMEIL